MFEFVTIGFGTGFAVAISSGLVGYGIRLLRALFNLAK